MARRALSITFITIVAVFILIQLIPVSRDNPAVAGDFNGDIAIKQILKKSCYDCHSNETIWPWYSYVAPVSWLVASDVHEGRDHFNFSDWQTYTPKKQHKIMEHAWEEIDHGEMPLGIYLIMHSDAKLSDSEKILIQNWSGSAADTAKTDDE